MKTLFAMFGLGGMEMSLLSLIALVLWIWALIDVIKSNLDGTTKIIWVLVIIVLPLLGSILYLLIGRKK
ncbi:MAG TPA: PLD nuclease N-terminal domain-containing protein [Ohtaekwangia sp.]